MCGKGKIRCYPYRFALSITSLEGVFLKNEIWDSYSARCFQNVRLDVKDQIIEQNVDVRHIVAFFSERHQYSWLKHHAIILYLN